MFPFNPNLFRTFTVAKALWKLNKSSSLPQMLSVNTLQGGSIKIIFNTSFISSFAPFAFFITPPCNDPMILLHLCSVRLCHLPTPTPILLPLCFSFSPLLSALIIQDDHIVCGNTLILFYSKQGNIRNDYDNRG